MDKEFNLIQLNPCNIADKSNVACTINNLQRDREKTTFKQKRKLREVKVIYKSSPERIRDCEEFCMPNLEGNSFVDCGTSIAQKRGIKLNINSNSISPVRACNRSPLKIREEIKNMKELSNNKNGFNCKSPTTTSYLFATHKSPKNFKEKAIVEYLNIKGIFQIHLSEALKEL